MQTEIIISEFTIRGRLKIGDLASNVIDKAKFGANIDDIVESATFLRYAINAINSDFNTWSEKTKIKRIEAISSMYNLHDKPYYSKDWLAKFTSVNPIFKTGSTYLEVPIGTGYVYRDYNNLELVNNSLKTDISQL